MSSKDVLTYFIAGHENKTVNIPFLFASSFMGQLRGVGEGNRRARGRVRFHTVLCPTPIFHAQHQTFTPQILTIWWSSLKYCWRSLTGQPWNWTQWWQRWRHQSITINYSVLMKLNSDVPQLLPMAGRRIKIYYSGIKRLCTRCFGHHNKKDCRNKKVQWIEKCCAFIDMRINFIKSKSKKAS